nr:MAG TPA: hypothetical protein [Caudoviricetes sp.]
MRKRQRAPCNGRASTSSRSKSRNRLGFESPAFH